MKDSHIDDKIRQALSDEDAREFEQFAAEPSLLELAMELFKRRN